MKVGKQTFKTPNVYINDTNYLVGKREHEGALSSYFEHFIDDDLFNTKSYELAEVKMQRHVLSGLLDKNNLKPEDIDILCGGDLQNQIFATSFSAREFHTSFMGLYNACSTFGEGLSMLSMLISSNAINNGVVITSSHFSTAEKNYRYPLELGNQRTPLSQWTVTGAGAVYLSNNKYVEITPKITSVTIGKIIDYGVKDANNMGAAMAPAAFDTIKTHFNDLGIDGDYYDVIATGDLGIYGIELLEYLMNENNMKLFNNIIDCGKMIYKKEQKVFMGGSGAGCSSSVFSAYFYKKLKENEIKRMLLVPTGALLNKDSPLQKQSIPGIAHAVAIEV